ncbi:MAG: winged helix-turn-helix transcriptional regulator [Candidatus Freyarchaeota archaeon]|nr:winged helix-turn-helix transcriptional regulator [Candidatus Jordarchaeia archaeon]
MKVEDFETAFERILGMRESSLKVLVYILVRGGRVTPKEIVDETGLSQNSVWKAVRRLEAAGVIRSVERGSYEANYGFILALLLLKLQRIAKVVGEGGVGQE